MLSKDQCQNVVIIKRLTARPIWSCLVKGADVALGSPTLILNLTAKYLRSPSSAVEAFLGEQLAT